MQRGARWFCAALVLALFGSGALVLAIASAFSRAGSGWEDAVAYLGMGTLVLGGLCNLLAAWLALAGLFRERALQWWHVPCLILAVLSFYWGWMAVNL